MFYSKIYLVGMPGVGKTTIGRQLAKQLNYDFVDLDEQIIAKTQKSIAEIFAEFDEDYFRKLESEVLHETKLLSNSVIATGGGLPCFFDNMNFLNQQGISIWLQMGTDLLAERIFKGKNTRPMFKGKTVEEIVQILAEKLAQREIFYRQARHHFEVENLHLETIIFALSAH
ncbi:MAG: shikimate kinase [Verrucomicrobia bacterium]|nr:shikimate kinase [Cytophagales bacterium]